MTNTRLVVTMAVMPIVVALTVGLGRVWLTGDVRLVNSVGLAAAIVGAGLVGYFNWRARFRRRVLDGGRHERNAA